jgi:hypothetical protein
MTTTFGTFKAGEIRALLVRLEIAQRLELRVETVLRKHRLQQNENDNAIDDVGFSNATVLRNKNDKRSCVLERRLCDPNYRCYWNNVIAVMLKTQNYEPIHTNDSSLRGGKTFVTRFQEKPQLASSST